MVAGHMLEEVFFLVEHLLTEITLHLQSKKQQRQENSTSRATAARKQKHEHKPNWKQMTEIPTKQHVKFYANH